MAEPTPDVGAMRHRVTWQKLGPAQLDSMNQRKQGWTTVGTYWARVEPLAGMELMNARQLKSTTSHKVTMRNVGQVKATHRLLFEGTGRAFYPVSVFRLDERNAYLSIHCTEEPDVAAT